MRHPLLGLDPELSLDRFAELFAAGDLYFGDYFRHVLGWIAPSGAVEPRQVCVLRYEDMVERKLRTVEQLQEFLLPGAALEPQVLEAIAASTGFETMKQQLSANPGSFHLNPAVYFRSGTTDDWRQHLSPAAEALIRATCLERWGAHADQPLLAPYLTAMAGG